MANAKDIIYTGLNLSHISVPPNTDLATALGSINTTLASGTPYSPDYTGFNLYCVKEIDGTTHPTNTQNFAEGISKALCDFKTAYTTFTGTTYVTDQGVLTTAINAIHLPALTYVPFSITNTDTITQVFTKSFTGYTGIINSIKPDSANWSSIGAGATTSIVSAFNTLIAYEVTQDTATSGKQASLGTFNTSAIGGTTGVAPITTIAAIIAYAATLPTYATGSVTWGCVTQGGTLTTDIDHIVVKVNSLTSNYLADIGTGLTKTSIGSCQGYRASIDSTWTGLYKVAVNSTDSGAGTGDYLINKIVSGDSSVTITDTGTHLNLAVAHPLDYKVKVNSSDSAQGYLIDKLPATIDSTWGLMLNSVVVNNQVALTPTVGNPNLFYQAFTDWISNNPAALTTFANLVAQSQATPGTSISNLVVTLTTGAFVLTWTHQSGISQNAKWRVRGQALWNTNLFTPADPLSSTAATTTNSNGQLNTPEQFQVDTVYASGTVGSNIYEMISYSCQTVTPSVSTGVISVSQPSLPYVDTIQYQLYNSVPTLLQTITTSGGAPNVSFTAVVSGTYSVKWRMGTTINGGVLYSDDSTQLNAYCVHGSIVVP